MDEDSAPTTWWDKKEYASSNYGAAELKNLFSKNDFDFPKAKGLVFDCLKAAGATYPKSLVLDFLVALEQLLKQLLS
ncbi:hypothetical protein ABIE61_002871 [Marinobacterium sp. MBR-111]|jgi:adenine-specific DNA-methyltransferase|uniref:hypothetical protein n=1 Tax=Marinobacterium sp. MBR-111 TaxID=3156463 RepID=UPI00339715CF